MTRTNALDFPLFTRGTVGFDRLFNELDRQFSNSVGTSYPPYNISRVGENDYEITLAVAGFSTENIEVEQNQNLLKVKGSSEEKEEDSGREYLHRGIASRSFERSFTLANHVNVTDAAVKDGMLTISLTREVPEELQPRKIAITTK